MLKVLVVDDLAVVRALIRQQLAVLGITWVAEAADGADALHRLSREPDIDLILCDWHMMPMDGFDFCARVQATPYLGGRKIPVVFITGDQRLADADRRRRALDSARGLGIVDILVKPFGTEELRAVLAQCAPSWSRFKAGAPAQEEAVRPVTPDGET